MGIRRASMLKAGATMLLFAISVPASATTSYTYDLAGRVVTALYDNGTCVIYAYDANGNRTSQTVPPASAGSATWGSGVYGCFRWSP